MCVPEPPIQSRASSDCGWCGTSGREIDPGAILLAASHPMEIVDVDGSLHFCPVYELLELQFL